MRFADDMGEKLDLGIRSGLLQGVHALHVSLKGERTLEAYFAGRDENWGRPLGEVAFDGETLHDLRSVTKSITSLLYGIALEAGQVPPPEAPLMEAFPQYADLSADPQRAGWTVGHVLNMTMGTEWNEDLPYTDPANSEIRMEEADDRYRFILEQPIVAEPGAVWNYNGGCSALIGYLIETGTGQTLEAYGREVLFGPLGIEDVEWNAGADGVLSAASGLRLRLPDLARIGQMLLAGGAWQGRQVVPVRWIETFAKPEVWAGFFEYSHQWYISEQYVPAAGGMRRAISAMGNGGQRLIIMPDLELVMAMFAGHYNRPDQWINPTLVLQRIVLENLRA